ncbi:multisubunit potassium/proton antiporter, PhaA subunit/multisubunit potassium/proton antiporter [Rubellimicrobium thermophilum DSM 16684]|uniref:Multisubunit potassium/proton antiporter, PhaA subunit/multisubunit potassium/proton antiporter n=1 Tax=Rubellimicrobium thermophilum DSM 16684 TaxID=1123069 RepID=S9QU74_9RHOB|nr:multisubunit potassium/proton antiporter, PhaA subunit/multisubunit potassium/proton antiporter [Rubellimicrobium thermophilum DSM 16684]
MLAGPAFRLGRPAGVATALAGTAAALVLLLGLAPGVLAGQVPRVSVPWLPALGLNASLFLDPLGLLFAGLILGIGLLVLLYARAYLHAEEAWGRFFVVLLLFQGAMLGIVLADNVLLLVVFWELTSLTSFLLIGYWNDRPESRRGARMALVVTGSGGLLLLAGLLLLGGIAGSFELSVILTRREAIQASPLYLPALLLILGGCFTKSAQFPFHFWLPQAMAAPTPVSAYLHSATMVKAGVFLLARLWPVLAGTEAWSTIVAPIGLATMLVGAAVALFQNDLKGLLAYSTVSHLGLLVMLLGFGTPAAAAVAVLHIVNHAAFKAALFMNAGIVDHETGSRDIRALGGLYAVMPIAGTLALLAAASMAGLPPFGGFISKELMLEEALHTAWGANDWIVPALATVAAAFSVAYSLRYVGHVYLGPRMPTPKAPHDPPAGLWLPSAILVVIAVLAGIAPQTTLGWIVTPVADAVTGGLADPLSLKLWHGVTPALLLSILAVGVGLMLLGAHGPLERTRPPMPQAPRIFDALVAAAVRGSRVFTHALHEPSLQRTLAVLFATSLALAGLAGWGLPLTGDRPRLPASPVAIIVWFGILAATGAVVVLHRRRFLALVLISVIGLGVSLAFVHLSAPDLALTQISVEIVTILLMLLALNLLPKDSPPLDAPMRRLRDGLLACAGGLAVGLGAWAVMTRIPDRTLPDWFWANAYPGGGGTNVVNVILVDFRGFDTFGEIIVLGIAALGIYALLDTTARGAAGRRLARRAAAGGEGTPRSPERHPLMLVVASRVILPLAVVTGLFIFLRGHNMPGGGFIAGLVFSIALLVQYMASGWDWAQQRQRIPEHALVAAGVLAAAFTGLGAILLGLPFLTSGYDYFTLPVVGEFELATAMLFDIGVSLTVVGAVMMALSQLARVAQRAETLPADRSPMDIDPSRDPEGAR